MTVSPGDPVLAPEALAAHPGEHLVLDARPAAAFAAARARASRWLPIEAWEHIARTASGALSEADFWARQIGRLGVDGRRPVAVLDDGRMTEAARAWFILQHFGVPATVVDGGWPELEPLLRAAGALETGQAVPPAPVVFVPRPGTGRVALTERTALRDAVATGAGPRILDVRTDGEYRGEDRRRNQRGGHLPGAAHLPHASLLASNNRLRPAAALRALLEDAGLQPGERVVTHCDGGGRAALAALAAVRAGHAEVSAYYLSFADWAADESCPVRR